MGLGGSGPRGHFGAVDQQGNVGGAFPGYGPAPPAVAPTSSAGASALVSRADHTHADILQSGVVHTVTHTFVGPYGGPDPILFGSKLLMVDNINVDLSSFNAGAHLWVQFDALWVSDPGYDPVAAPTFLKLILDGAGNVGDTDPPVNFLAAPALEISGALTKDPGPQSDAHHVVSLSTDTGMINPGGAAVKLALTLQNTGPGPLANDGLRWIAITISDGPIPPPPVPNPATTAALSALPTRGIYLPGQTAFVEQTGQTFVFEDSGNTAVNVPDGVRTFLVNDDIARTWVLMGISAGSLLALTAATPTALAALKTIGIFATGTQALVVSTGRIYILRAALSTAADGDWVVATNDDVTRQWIATQISNALAPGSGGPTQFLTAEIDMKVVQDVVLVPPLPARFRAVTGPFFMITQTTASTVPPTISTGTDAAFGNYQANQSPALFTTGVAFSYVTPNNAVPQLGLDLTALGLKLRISVGATATTLKARVLVLVTLMPV